MTEDLKKLETLDYKPDVEWMNAPLGPQPASAPPETLGFNSVVIKPETRVNKAEDAGQHEPVGCPDLDSMHISLPEQPNLQIIETIERYAELINLCLNSLVITDQEPGDSGRKLIRNQALEDNDIFQKTTLVKLRNAFE